MKLRAISLGIALATLAAFPLFTRAQDIHAPGAAAGVSPEIDADYPDHPPGILIQASDWIPIASEYPAKNRMKHGFAPALSYGIAPAAMVSDYEGAHASVQVVSTRPIICICHFYSIPGQPALVRLHSDPKKDLRELNAGNIHVGAKFEDASKNDLIPVNVSRPENMVWLVQPQDPLPPGEYALMLGTQNLIIFPFSVAAPGPASPASEKH